MPAPVEKTSVPVVAGAEIVVADTSPVRVFVEAGAQRAFADYLGTVLALALWLPSSRGHPQLLAGRAEHLARLRYRGAVTARRSVEPR
jgi:hypothetical protein